MLQTHLHAAENTHARYYHTYMAILLSRLTYSMYTGAGLGRLCLELTNQGFEVQGNEFSYYMLLTSSFILNNTERAEQWTVFPWMHSNCNQKSIADQLRGVRFC